MTGVLGLALTIGAGLLGTPARPTRAQVARDNLRGGQGPLIHEAQTTADAALMLPPIGFGGEWYADTLPQGPEGVQWAWLDGGALPIADYPDLYDLWGTKWNTGGEPPGHFRKPDRRQRVGVGAGNSGAAGLTARSLGERFGTEAHPLTGAETGPHLHAGSTTSDAHSHGGSTSQNTHYHEGDSYTGTETDARAFYSDGSMSIVWKAFPLQGITASDSHSHTIGTTSDSHFHTVSTTNSGGGAAHPNIQPSIAVHHIVRVL